MSERPGVPEESDEVPDDYTGAEPSSAPATTPASTTQPVDEEGT